MRRATNLTPYSTRAIGFQSDYEGHPEHRFTYERGYRQAKQDLAHLLLEADQELRELRRELEQYRRKE